MPFFTIIIPTYNRASLISKAIESVLAQSFSDWELLIIDDGSTDDTKTIVSNYNDTRIKYIYQKNAERCAARNNGIDNASGAYICFLDSDDYYLHNRLEGLHSELQKRNFPIAAFYTGILWERNGSINESADGFYRPANILDSIALSVIHSQRTCIHYSILKQYKYNNAFHIGEDMELWIRIATTFDFIFLVNQLTVVLVEHEDQTVNVERDNIYFDQLQTLRFIFSPVHPGNKISANIKSKLLSNCFYGIGKYFIYKGRRWQAAAKLARSIMAEPSSIYFKFRLNVFLKLILLSPMPKVKELIAI